MLYESHLIAQADETGASHDVDHAFISPAVAEYFQKESLDEKKTMQRRKEQALHAEAPDVSSSLARSVARETRH